MKFNHMRWHVKIFFISEWLQMIIVLVFGSPYYAWKVAEQTTGKLFRRKSR